MQRISKTCEPWPTSRFCILPEKVHFLVTKLVLIIKLVLMVTWQSINAAFKVSTIFFDAMLEEETRL